jgi:hypothetical protein
VHWGLKAALGTGAVEEQLEAPGWLAIKLRAAVR